MQSYIILDNCETLYKHKFAIQALNQDEHCLQNASKGVGSYNLLVPLEMKIHPTMLILIMQTYVRVKIECVIILHVKQHTTH